MNGYDVSRWTRCQEFAEDLNLVLKVAGDGCMSGAPLVDGIHLDKNGLPAMVCQKPRYEKQPVFPMSAGEERRKGERRVKSRRIIETTTPNPNEPTVFMFWERGALRWQPCQRVNPDRRLGDRRKGAE